MSHILPKLTVVYDPHSGAYCRDSEAEKLVFNAIETFFNDGQNKEIIVGTELLIHYFRLFLCRGEIGSDNIEFKFENITLKHNKQARIEHWPKGFCDYTDDILLEILTKQHEKWKKSKQK